MADEKMSDGERYLAERRTMPAKPVASGWSEVDAYIGDHLLADADPVFADFLQHYGQVAAAAENEEDTTRMARLFWFTVEFGLIREDGQIKVYGSGLISSHGDAANALGPTGDRRPFSLDAVFNQHFEIDHFQDVLFVTESFDQLYQAVEEAGRRIGTIR